MIEHRNAVSKKPGRVVVLGASGFISRHLQGWCRSEGIDCLPVGSGEVDLSVVENAPRLAALLRSGDSVVMTSTLTPEKGKDYRTLMRNLRMAETVCLALEQVPCAHFIYLSSDAVYDAHEIPVDERSSRQPADVYALSHAAREMMFELALKATAIPLCILRLTSIYGPGDTHNSYGPNRFVRSALKDGGIGLFGNGEELRSHVFVEDAVALTGLALKHVSFGTVNVANQPAVSFLDIAQIVAGLAGRPVRIGNLPRATPVVHRTFENAALRAAFPEFHFKNLEKGLTMFMESERASANVTGNALSKGKK